ncbi:MAG: hypothetical protein RQ753_00895 [Desulfurivibrionaceae bacterium]|nr:hypothetical protein [Desulfurivibrionaceae bacterium]
MKISKRLLVGSMLTGAVALGMYAFNLPTDVSAMGSKPETKSGAMTKSGDTYEATFYVAGMGGHFAEAVTTIDPAAAQPIKVSSLTKIDIGTRDSHPTHDARIDKLDRDTMFWSTYKIDKEAGGVHVGKTDLKTGKVIQDVVVDVPALATNTKSMYCASGQSEKSFIPMTMTSKAYIDVFNKSDLKRAQRVFLEGTEADTGPYKFYHGISSTDMKKLLIIKNAADKDHGKTSGKVDLVELDMAALEKGEVKVLNKNTVAGSPDTVTFRAYYSPDDSMIAASGADVMFLLDAKTLEAMDVEPMANLEQNHDAMFTPDGKYIIATSRTKQAGPECEDPKAPKAGEFTMDGQLKLYNVASKMFVGEATSVCLTCHNAEGVEEHAVLCGLDGNFK